MDFNFQSLIAPFAGALAAYLAIREDLAALKATQKAHADDIREAKEAAKEAHERINRLTEKSK